MGVIGPEYLLETLGLRFGVSLAATSLRAALIWGFVSFAGRVGVVAMAMTARASGFARPPF
jgi:hypothetical protein